MKHNHEHDTTTPLGYLCDTVEKRGVGVGTLQITRLDDYLRFYCLALEEFASDGTAGNLIDALAALTKELEDYRWVKARKNPTFAPLDELLTVHELGHAYNLAVMNNY